MDRFEQGRRYALGKVINMLKEEISGCNNLEVVTTLEWIIERTYHELEEGEQ